MKPILLSFNFKFCFRSFVVERCVFGFPLEYLFCCHNLNCIHSTDRQSGVSEGCDKNVGVGLYGVCGRFPACALVHRPTVVKYVADGRISTHQQIEAMSVYMKKWVMGCMVDPLISVVLLTVEFYQTKHLYYLLEALFSAKKIGNKGLELLATPLTLPSLRRSVVLVWGELNYKLFFFFTPPQLRWVYTFPFYFRCFAFNIPPPPSQP